MATKLIAGETDLKLGLPDSKAFSLFFMSPKLQQLGNYNNWLDPHKVLIK